jgi:hypothetical protein
MHRRLAPYHGEGIVIQAWANMSIAVMALLRGKKEIIARMLIMCSGFSREKRKWPKDDMRHMYLKE